MKPTEIILMETIMKELLSHVAVYNKKKIAAKCENVPLGLNKVSMQQLPQNSKKWER